MALKRENDKFSAMTLDPVSGPIGLGNHPRSPKLWAIAHENNTKTRKRKVFSHDSQTCLRSNRPCESPQNPKSMGYNSLKRPKNVKTTSFSHDSQTCNGSNMPWESP